MQKIPPLPLPAHPAKTATLMRLNTRIQQFTPAVAECISCHMPRVTKSAVGNADMFTGDIRTHLMGIDATQIEQFTEDGSQALSELGLNFACRSCHVDGGSATVKTDEELIDKAFGYHDRPETP